MCSNKDLTRCSWVNLNNPRYVAYHDSIWGKPIHDDQKLFKMLILEIFQSGLSWECILNKEPAFCEAFSNFDIETVESYDQAVVESLCHNPNIVRNRRKIEAAIHNAHIFKSIQQEYGSFDAYIWHWTQRQVIYETGLTKSPLSQEIAQDLKCRSMKFVGSTVIYAYLQAIGIVNSHEPQCFLSSLENSDTPCSTIAVSHALDSLSIKAPNPSPEVKNE